MAKALLGAGADRNAAAADGRTAVLQAVVSENIDVLRALLDAKPDLSARMMAPEPIDAISVALGKRRADLVGLLLAAGADPMVKIDDEVSLLEFAILSGQPDMASMFRNAGVPEPSADRLDELRRPRHRLLVEQHHDAHLHARHLLGRVQRRLPRLQRQQADRRLRDGAPLAVARRRR